PGGRLPEPQVAADLAALAEFQGQLRQVAEVRLLRSRLGARPAHTPVAVPPLRARSPVPMPRPRGRGRPCGPGGPVHPGAPAPPASGGPPASAGPRPVVRWAEDR